MIKMFNKIFEFFEDVVHNYYPRIVKIIVLSFVGIGTLYLSYWMGGHRPKHNSMTNSDRGDQSTNTMLPDRLHQVKKRNNRISWNKESPQEIDSFKMSAGFDTTHHSWSTTFNSDREGVRNTPIDSQNIRSIIKVSPMVDSPTTHNKLKSTISFNTPDTLILDIPHQIVLLVSNSDDYLSLSRKMKDYLLPSQKEENIKSDSLETTEVMEAALAGDGFKIEQITQTRQITSANKETRWEWTIVPVKKGVNTLYLTLNCIMKVGNNEVPRTIETYRKPICVYVKLRDRLKKVFDNEYSVIVITGLLGVLWGRFTKRDKPNESEEKKEVVASLEEFNNESPPKKRPRQKKKCRMSEVSG